MLPILRARPARLAACGALLLSLGAPPVHATPPYLGMPLQSALVELRQRGLRIVFADNLVPATLRVEIEPAAATPRAVLDELLAPHGLAAREGPGGILVVVRRPPATDGVGADAARPAAVFAEELYVTPSGISMLRDQPVSLVALGRDDLLALPHLGDDFFRSLSLLPGATANDASARVHLRGGWRDETQVVLDGQELYQAYHLADFDDASSVVAPSSLGAADLLTAGFPARYGDRMAGVLDLQTRAAGDSRRTWLGVGALSLEAGGAGPLGRGGGHWLLAARRGAIDLVARLLGDEDPSYADVFGKLDFALGDRHALRLDALYADDRLRFAEQADGDQKLHDTAYGSSYVWLTLHSLLGPALYAETVVSLARADRDRLGEESEEDAGFAIRDRRDFDISELGQDWAFEASARQSLAWGGSWRHASIDYDYRSRLAFDNPLALIRSDAPSPGYAFTGAFAADQTGAWLEHRSRPGAAWTWEGGLRWDHTSMRGESVWSPRASLARALGERAVLRLAWGRYTQSQRIYELGVEDGETAFAPVERAEHRVAGFERTFARPGGDLGLRIELYQRRVTDPRQRYANLFEALNTFPEAEPDRVRFRPQASRAEGLEIYLRGAQGRLRWSGSYTASRTRDRLDGEWTPRLFDERHAVKLDADYPVARGWRVNMAWRFHTGWPTTPLTAVEQDGDDGVTAWVPRLGPLNRDRLTSYHRLDLRASRRWQAHGAAWDVFVDVQNVYDRKNAAGFDLSIDPETGAVDRVTERWAGILPSLGVRVEF